MASTIPAPKRPVRPGATKAPVPAKPAPKRSTAPSRPAPAPTRKSPVNTSPAIDMTKVRAVAEWRDINDIVPYEFNARHNEKAVTAVMESIRNFGFIIPVVIDENGVLAAGHTRVEAAKNLGMAEVLALTASHLTTEQIDAFRLIDNKVSEIADWDTDLLGQELARLTEFGFNFTDYGWNQEEIDCLSSVVAADCLSVGDLTPATQQAEEQEAGEEGTGMSIRRGPQTTRLVLGELVIYVPTTNYRDWIDGVQRMHNFDKAEIEAHVLNRLGILR